MSEPPKLKRCPICKGRGALRCDCWPGDCICGWDDEPCEACGGHGWYDYDYDDYAPASRGEGAIESPNEEPDGEYERRRDAIMDRG